MEFDCVKRILSISLIAVMLLNSLVYLFLFPIMIDLLKGRFIEEREKENYTPNKIIEVYNGQRRNFIFVDDNEIKIGNSMYDIIRVEKDGNKTTYYCYYDNEEENLEKNFGYAQRDKTERPRHTLRNIAVNIFVLSGSGGRIFNPYKELDYPNIQIHNFKPAFTDVITPPPNKACLYPL